MKKSILAMLFCCFLCISAFAQNQRVKMPGEKVTVAQLFNEIESQTGMSVDYDASKVDVSRTVSVPSGTLSVKDIVDKKTAWDRSKNPFADADCNGEITQADVDKIR